VAGINAPVIFFVLAGGILPAVFWLWFWLKEDPNPEPSGIITLTFLAGALSVLFVFPLQSIAMGIFTGGFLLLFVWAGIEEFMKLVAAYVATLHRKALNEPIDYMMYMISTALGFAAFENALFILKSYGENGVGASLVTLAMRFVGAMLLHVLASSVLSGIYAMAFCKGRTWKVLHTILGLAVATALHAIFNFYIINATNTLVVFIILWIAVVALLLFFERVKHLVCVLPYKLRRNKKVIA